MSHVYHLLHQRQCGLHALHPRLRTAMQGLHFTNHLLAVLVVHLRELSHKDGVHLVLGQLMGNLHVGKGQETSREALRRSKRALTRVGIEQHLLTLGAVVVGQQALGHHPLAEELPHSCFQHATTQRQLAAGRRPLKPLVGRYPHIGSTARSQRRADVVAAHHHHFLQSIPGPEVVRAFRLCRSS